MQDTAAPTTPPNFIDVLLAEFDGDLDEAVRTLRARVNENPVDMRLNLQVLLNVMGDEAAAFSVADELLALAPDDPRVLFNRGWHMLRRGRFAEGFALLEHGRTLRTYGHAPIDSIRPFWNAANSRAGDAVLLVLEGGLGDEIIHARFARRLAREYGQKVVVICQPALASLFHRMPEVSAVAQREACLGVYHDHWLPGMSAPRILGAEPGSLDGSPYLKADPARVRKWQPFVEATAGPRLKIGIRWAGSPVFEHQQLRKFPPEILLRLAKIPGVQLYSFQRDNDVLNLPPGIVDLAPFLGDWDDTAAFAEHMDLVISSCTSVAHLSAAIGKRTWVIAPVLPYFVWALPGETSPWYESVRLFRQGRFGAWDDVVTSVHDAVTALAATR